jgi:hypothetical protein
MLDVVHHLRTVCRSNADNRYRRIARRYRELLVRSSCGSDSMTGAPSAKCLLLGTAAAAASDATSLRTLLRQIALRNTDDLDSVIGRISRSNMRDGGTQPVKLKPSANFPA